MSVGPNAAATGMADRVTQYDYNALDELVSEIDPDPTTGLATGQKTSYTYDGDGNEATVTDTFGNLTQYFYNPLGELDETILPSAGTSIGYQGAATSYIDYNALGEVSKTIDAGGNTITYGYDADGNETSETDPAPLPAGTTPPAGVSNQTQITTMTYDALGEMLSETDPLQQTTTYKYDAMGNQVEIDQPTASEPNGAQIAPITTMAYNGDGQVTNETSAWQNGTTRITTYDYDDEGQLEVTTEPDNSTDTLSYNNLGEVVEDYEVDAVSAAGAAPNEQTTYQYNTLGQQIGETDPNGAVTVTSYDNADEPLLSTVTGTDGTSQSTLDTYDAAGDLVQTETGPAGANFANPAAYASSSGGGAIISDVAYVYDAAGDEIQQKTLVQNSVGGAAHFAYTSTQYDNLGRAWDVTQPPLATGPQAGLSPETQTGYNAVGEVSQTNVLTASDTFATTTYSYDAEGNPYQTFGPAVTVTNAQGQQSSATPTTTDFYDADGDLLYEQAPNGSWSKYVYDALGNAIQLIQADPATGQIDSNSLTTLDSYDAGGDLVAETNPRGYTTTFMPSKMGETTQTMLASGAEIDATYDSFGNQLTSTDAHYATGQSVFASTSNAYNSSNQLVTTATGGNTTTLKYNGLGQQTDTISPRLGDSHSILDALGQDDTDTAPNPTAAGAPASGPSTSRVMSSTGLVLSSTDASGTTNYTYDDDGNLIEERDPNGEDITYQYDVRGNQISETDANTDAGADTSTTTTDTFDAAGNNTSETVSSAGVNHTTTYGYDIDGNVTYELDPDGQVITSSYDALDRQTGEKWYPSTTALAANTPSNVESFGYDADGNLVAASDNNSSYTFTYDSTDRLLTVNNAGTAGSPNVVLTDGYGDVGQGARGDDLRTSLTATGAAAFLNTYQYDSSDNLASISQSGSGVAPKTVNFAYNNDNDVTSIDRYAGSSLAVAGNYTYDLDDRTSSLTYSDGGVNIEGYGWTYNAAGLVQTFSSTTDGVATYGYDANGQLTSATYGSGSQPNETYTYDQAGNRATVGSSTTTVTAFNQVTNDGTYSYLYDANGNEIRQTTLATGAYTVFGYDVGNRLTTATLYNSAGVMTEQINYTYDVFNNLIGRVDTLYSAAGVATSTSNQRLIYDDPADNGQALLNFETTDGTTPTAANLVDRYLWGPAVDQLLADEQVTNPDSPGNILWPLADDQGTIRDIVNSSGQVLDHITYSAFGQALSHTAANPAAVDTIFANTGKYTDPVTGLQWNIGRWYNPMSGTWMTPDPAEADNNTYRYLSNGPADGADPDGLEDQVSVGTYEDAHAEEREMYRLNEAARNLFAPSMNGSVLVGPSVSEPIATLWSIPQPQATAMLFYRGMSLGAAMEVVQSQSFDVSRIAGLQALTGQTNTGVYISSQSATGRYWASIAGMHGRGLGPAVVRVEVPRAQFEPFAQNYSISVETPVARMPGMTETLLPFENVQEFESMAKFSLALAGDDVIAQAPQFRFNVGIKSAAGTGEVAAWSNLLLAGFTVGADYFLQKDEHDKWVQNTWIPLEIAARTQMRQSTDGIWAEYMEQQRQAPERDLLQAKSDVSFYNKMHEQAKSQLVQLRAQPGSADFSGVQAALERETILTKDVQRFQQLAKEAEQRVRSVNP